MTDYRISHCGSQRGAQYDERYRQNTTEFYWTEFEQPLLDNIFQSLISRQPGDYLDFAVGTARVMQVASKHYSNLTGIDVSADMLQEARRKVPGARFIQADVTQQQVDVGKFGTITMFRFLLNAEPGLRLKILTWLRGRIDDSGYLVINNHMNKWSLTGLCCQIDNLLRRTKRHNTLSDSEVRKLLAESGFAITEHYGFNYLITHPGRFLIWRPPTLWIERVLMRVPFIKRFAKDRIYVCRPI